MKKENFIKLFIIAGVGYAVFVFLKNSKIAKTNQDNTTKAFDSEKSTPTPTAENAIIVRTAYTDAMNASESPSRLSELNKECMKEFGMRCYVDGEGKVVVCDAKGNIV
jgi:hypothetical protein